MSAEKDGSHFFPENGVRIFPRRQLYAAVFCLRENAGDKMLKKHIDKILCGR